MILTVAKACLLLATLTWIGAKSWIVDLASLTVALFALAIVVLVGALRAVATGAESKNAILIGLFGGAAVLGAISDEIYSYEKGLAYYRTINTEKRCDAYLIDKGWAAFRSGSFLYPADGIGSSWPLYLQRGANHVYMKYAFQEAVWFLCEAPPQGGNRN